MNIKLYTTTYKKKRRPRVAYSQFEAFALPKGSNKQQETYADMTEPHARIQQNGYKRHTHRHLLLTLILTLNDESCEVSNCQMQSVNKRYQYVQKIHPK